MLFPRATLAVLVLFLVGCRPSEAPAPDVSPTPQQLAGLWRAVLSSPGGELPFTLELREAAGELEAEVLNGDERVPASSVALDGDHLVIDFAWYDASLVGNVDDDGSRLEGRWRRTYPEGESTLPWVATRGDTRRFLPAESEPPADAPRSIGGTWAVELHDEDGVAPAQAELIQRGDEVHGTFLTGTGDYRYLVGRYEAGRLRLSTFDGAHVFLFDAVAEGDALRGDFWSRDTYHATWTARPVETDEQILPDAWTEVGLTNDDGRLEFTFPDLAGEPVSLADERFVGKAVLVNIFGSWCPNCNDEAPHLARWYRELRDRGLEIVGLAYEFTGDVERDRRQVRRFAERHGIDYPLLLAGVSDKRQAAATLPDLTAVLAYPTTIFVGRDGTVKRIHSGFAGPGTGEHHERLVAELEEALEELLTDPA